MMKFGTVVLSLTVACGVALADNNDDHGACAGLPSQSTLRSQLKAVVSAGNNAGFGNNMWATVVNRDGVICAVAFTGNNRGDQWPGSRVISAQKGNTANAFSLNGLALSTANLYPLVQPGAPLFGLSDSNPVDTEVAYGGNSKNYGQSNDPMVGNKIGGVNTFGGGLALYNASGQIIGGLGVSGDTSCTDHFISWKVRNGLGLDKAPTCDSIAFPSHPNCGSPASETTVLNGLPKTVSGTCP